MSLLRRLAVAVAVTVVLAVSWMPVQPAAAADFTPAPTPEGYPERVMGQADAPVTIVEYSSLTCPHCAAFHADTLPRLKEEFIDTGRAKLVFRDFPLDPLALGAALMARCAPEQSYFQLLDVLFKTQDQWARAENPLEALKGYGRLAGMDAQTMNACFENQQLVDAIQQVRQQANAIYGIDSTPSFVIDGQVHAGNRGYDYFAEAIRKAAPGDGGTASK